MAKQGGVESCAIILATHDGGVLDCWANRDQVYTLIGGLEGLKRDFMDSVIGPR